jgi:hypothetical protein
VTVFEQPLEDGDDLVQRLRSGKFRTARSDGPWN